MPEDSLSKRYLIKVISSIVNAIMNVIMVAIVPSALGPTAYGQFIYLQQFFEKLTAFLDAGTSLAFFSKLSAKPTRRELISFYLIFSVIILLAILTICYGSQVFDISEKLLPGIPKHYLLTAAGFGFLIWFTQIFIKIADAHALTVSVEMFKIVHKILSLLLLLYFVYMLSFDLDAYFFYHYIVLLSFLIIIGLYFYRKGVFTRTILSFKFSFKDLGKEFIVFCSPLVVFTTFSVLAGIFDIWLLQTCNGSEEMSYYGLAYQIAAMCFLFTSAMTPIITREFAKLYANLELSQMATLFQRYIPMLYAIAAYFGIFIAFQAENLLFIFTDEQFNNALWVVAIMAFYPLNQTYGQLSGSIFYATEQTRLYRNIGLISVTIGLPITISLIYLLDFGAIGLATKMVLVQLISVNLQLYYNTKLLGLKMHHFTTHQISTAVLFSLFAFVSSYASSGLTNHLLSLLTSGVIYTAFVIMAGIIYPSLFSLTRHEVDCFLKRLVNVFNNS